MQILTIDTVVSKKVLFLIIAVHLLASIAVIISGLLLGLKLVALGLLLLSCLSLLNKYRQSYRLCSAITYHDDIASQKRTSSAKRGWQIKDSSGQWQDATLKEHNILLDFYISLVFVTTGGDPSERDKQAHHKTHQIHVPLIRGDISEDSFRALKVLLRYLVA